VTNAINDAASSRKAIHVSCSTHSGPAGFTEDPAAEGCEPDYIHLTGVDAVLRDAQRCGKYLTLCGEPIARSALPGALCSAGCERQRVYCLGCIREANKHNWEAGGTVDCPPGIYVRSLR
jgi:hypothetical protein